MFDQNAENYINDQNIEISWAIKAYKQAEVHFNLLQAFSDCSKLRLTNVDSELFDRFNETFPELGIELLDENDIKNDDAKTKWRQFCNDFEGKVEDFNFATLLRLDCCKGYDEDNTIIVPRVQFLAIEVARNRRHINKIQA